MFSSSKFTKLILEDTVKTIGDGAFAGCTGLTGELNIPAGVTSIGVSSFANTGFQSAVISDTVETLNSNVFQNCTSLIDVTINAIGTLKSDAFKGCSNITNLTIDGIETIEEKSFEDCTSVTNLVIKHLDTINCNIFAYKGDPSQVGYEPSSLSKSVVNLEIYDTQTIGDTAFSGYKKLKKVTINNVNKIDRYAFGSSGVEEAYVSNVYEDYCGFGFCNYLTSIKFSNVEIMNGSFEKCGALENVILSNVKHLKSWTFSECKNLKQIRIPASVLEVGYDTFNVCPNLTSIILEKGSPLEIPEDKWGATNATVTREQ